MNGKLANHLSAVKTAGGGIAKKFHFHPSYPVFSLHARRPDALRRRRRRTAAT